MRGKIFTPKQWRSAGGSGDDGIVDPSPVLKTQF